MILPFVFYLAKAVSRQALLAGIVLFAGIVLLVFVSAFRIKKVCVNAIRKHGMASAHLLVLASFFIVLLTERIAGLKYFGQNCMALGLADS